MSSKKSQHNDFNVLASRSEWAWPRVANELLKPRGINMIVAQTASEFVDILEHRPIHAGIIDADYEQGGLTTMRLIQQGHPQVPCVMLAKGSTKGLLGEALKLGAFSVIDKPVDMRVLQQLLDRVFLKTYNSKIFS